MSSLKEMIEEVEERLGEIEEKLEKIEQTLELITPESVKKTIEEIREAGEEERTSIEEKVSKEVIKLQNLKKKSSVAKVLLKICERIEEEVGIDLFVVKQDIKSLL